MDFVAPIKALADETRLRIYAVLAKYEMNVFELTQLFDMGQSRISRHLRILSDTELIVLRRQGQWSFYKRAQGDPALVSLTNGVVGFVADWIDLRQDTVRAAAIVAARNQESKRFFANIAGGHWSDLRAELTGGVDLDGQVIEWLEKRGTVADIGCGTGDLLLRICSFSDHVIGVDHSQVMLDQLRLRLRDAHQACDLRIGDATHLPLRDEEADTVLLNMVLHHLPQPDAVFDELNRVTRKGGQLLLVDLEIHDQTEVAERFGDVWMGFSQTDLAAWLSQGGWRLERHQKIDIGLGMRAHIISAKKERK